MRKELIGILFIFSLIGCNSQSKTREEIVTAANGSILKKIYLDDTLLSEQQFIRREGGILVAQGYFKQYHGNGCISDSANFVDNTKQGIERSYLDNGRLRQTARYDKGILQECNNFSYYDDGILAKWNYSLEGKLSGNQFDYYRDGSLRKISYHVSNDEIGFFVSFDETGRIDSMEGNPIHVVAPSKRVKVKEVTTIANLAFKTPFILPCIEIQLRSLKNDALLKKIETCEFQHWRNNDVYFFDYSFKEEGRYLYSVNVKLSDSTGNTLIRNVVVDTLSVVE